MIPQKIESEEATYSTYAKSEDMSITEDPVSCEPENSGRWEPKIKLKKVRSIRVHRVSSRGSSTRGAKSQYVDSPVVSSVDPESSERPSPIQMPDASPNYMKGTSSSHAKESFQSSQRMLPRKGLTRMSTLKLKRTMSRKLSGASELKRKLKSSRSFKVGTIKGIRRTNPSDMQLYLTNAGNKSQRVITRRLSLRPVRILTKMPTSKSKTSMETTPQSPDSSLHKATCSSIFKDSHFPDHIELPQEGSGYQGVPDTKKFCPYTYCSLHGRHRDNLPPLKRFFSMRRRQLKNQKSMKTESTRSKQPSKTQKGAQKSRIARNKDHTNKEAPAGRCHFEKVKKLAGDSPVRTRNSLACTLTEDGTSGGDDKENRFFSDNAEVLLGETSHPHLSYDEYVNDSLGENGYSLSSFMPIEEPYVECCRIVTGDNKPGSSYIKTAGNVMKEVACEKNDETSTSILIDDQLETTDPEIAPLEHHGLCGKHSLLTDDGAVAGNEKLMKEIFEETQEERNPTQKLVNPESAGGDLNAYDIANSSDQVSTESRGLNPNDFLERKPTNMVMPSVSDVETTEEAIPPEPDHKTQKMSSPQAEFKPASSTDTAYKMQARDHKYIKMWHLIYKHAVLSTTGKGEQKLNSDGEKGEALGQDDFAFIGAKSSSQECCETDQVVNDETENVVELVQRAFDEILLSETEDLSSDDQLKTRGCKTSDQGLLEKSQRKLGESSILTSRESPNEEAWLKVDNSSSNEETTAPRIRNKPDQLMPKYWSNLKKLILLKRFVKALEKVRDLMPCKHRPFSLDANLEMEKVNLRHQTETGKKNAEEWMLDYALQKVISRLAPSQRQRVALLVEAFETIQPFQDTGSYATLATQANSVQALCDSSDHSTEETEQKSTYDYSGQLLLGKASCFYNRLKEYADNTNDDPMNEQKNPIWLEEKSRDFIYQEVKDISVSGAVDEEWKEKRSLASGCIKGVSTSSFNDIIYSEEIKCNEAFSMPDDVVSTFEEEAPTIAAVNKIPQDFNLNTEIPNGEFKLHERDFDAKNLISADGEHLSKTRSIILKGFLRSVGSNSVSSASPSDLLDESRTRADAKESIKETKLDTGTLEGFPALEESEAPTSTVIEPTQLEKQNRTRLWYLVYKHMASGIAGKYDSEPPVDGADQQEPGNDVGRVREANTSITHQSAAMMKQGMKIKDQDAADPEIALHQIEAIKMVEEAIDAILPDVQEASPDGQSLTDNVNLTNFERPNEAVRVYEAEQKPKEESMTSGNGLTQEGEEADMVSKERNKQDKHMSRSWSNLKKVVLLRRFIKALEKVRKLNPREPKYLSLESDPEAEKIELRHQDMDERKGAEEWMLDYALRQVVAKLTPARKRKVELLVEAFETVIPTIKN